MRSKVILALAVLNAVLLASLCTRWFTPSSASAQALNARPGDYTMLPGEIQGGNGGALVYIIDNSTGLLSARQFTGQQVVDMPAPMDLNRLLNPQTRH